MRQKCSKLHGHLIVDEKADRRELRTKRAKYSNELRERILLKCNSFACTHMWSSIPFVAFPCASINLIQPIHSDSTSIPHHRHSTHIFLKTELQTKIKRLIFVPFKCLVFGCVRDFLVFFFVICRLCVVTFLFPKSVYLFIDAVTPCIVHKFLYTLFLFLFFVLPFCCFGYGLVRLYY